MSLRLPFEPLEAYAEQRFGGRVVASDRDCATWTEASALVVLAEVVGVGRTAVWKWRHNGLSVEQADRIAVRLGLHPSCLWPEWYKLPVACDYC